MPPHNISTGLACLKLLMVLLILYQTVVLTLCFFIFKPFKLQDIETWNQQKGQ